MLRFKRVQVQLKSNKEETNAIIDEIVRSVQAQKVWGILIAVVQVSYWVRYMIGIENKHLKLYLVIINTFLNSLIYILLPYYLWQINNQFTKFFKQ